MTIVRWPEEPPAWAKVRDDPRRSAKIRDELHEAEVALRAQRERVAELRRQLPADTRSADQLMHEVRDGVRVDSGLGDLFTRSGLPLIDMHFTYGKAQEIPCPMCTCWADGDDGNDGSIPRIAVRAHFVVMVAGDAGAFGEYARGHGWRNRRIVSAGTSDFERRPGFESEDGAQPPGASVVLRAPDGSFRHTCSVCADLGERGFRGMDLFDPLWHCFDLLPSGRGDFMPQKSYAPGSSWPGGSLRSRVERSISASTRDRRSPSAGPNRQRAT